MPAPAVFRGGSDGAPSRVQRTGLRALPPQAAATATPAGIARGAGVIRRQAGGAVARERLRVVPIGQAPSLAGAPGTSALTVGGPGAPLQADVRARLESAFGADLDAVRVHEGTAAARLALGEGARAFAWGHHVVLGAGESPRDLALMAHEVAHVLQQRGAPAVQRCAGGTCGGGGGMGGAAHEAEAARAAAAVVGGGSYAVTGRAASGEAQHAGEDEGLLGYVVWPILDRVAPSLVPIIRRGAEGVADWVKGKVSDAVGAFVDSVMAPVRSVAATGKWLHAHFGPLLASIQDAAAKIAQNDCKPITDAAKKIEDFAAELITPVVEKLQFVANKVGDFLNGVWEKFGSPVWDFIKKYAGAQWDALQQLGSWIWDKTATVREYGAAAWRWLKNKIGIGDGPEGQNGILQWIQGKARTAWDWVQAKIEPYKKQLKTVATVVGAIVVMLSPAGPLILAGTAIYGIVQGVKWIRANLGGGDAIVRARVHAQTVLIPQLIATIGKATGAVTKMAGAVSGKLGEFSAGLGVLVGKAASTALQFLIDAAQWIAVKAQELADWAADKLNGAAAWLQTALTRLLAFLQPVLDFLGKVGRLIVDIYSLPLLLAGALWKKIPACIRDPFVDWIIPLILRQIDIFKELVKDDEAWAKTKADVMNIVRLVFVNKDLKGAIKATFHLILRVFNVPYDLLVQVVAKAQAAWETVTAAPIKFLKNIVRTLGRGLKLYWGKLKDNLLFGLEGWLFGAIADKGIAKPKSWTDPWDLMQFGLDVMGLSMSHIFELMEKRFEKSTVDRLRVWYARLGRAWDWIMDMKGKKPGEVTAEIIGAAKEMGKTMLEGIVIWIIEAVGTELATMATAAAASAGLSEVLDAVRRIYRAIKTAVRWARSIVDMVNRTLDAVADIAAGSLDGPAEILHGAMKKATPAVIGFLGDQVGLGDVVTEIRSLIDKVRKKVDDAILAIIDKLKAFFGAIVQGAKDLAGKVFEWWKNKIKLRAADGKPHQLSFAGERDSAVPMVASDPKTVEAFIAEFAAKPEAKTAVASGHVETVRGLLKTIRTEQKRPPAQQAKADEAIEQAFAAMAAPLEFLLGASGVNTNLDREEKLESAADRLAAITAMQGIGNAGSVGIPVVALLTEDRFYRYRDEYVKDYAPPKPIGASFQWPHRYLRLRAARRAGFDAEDKWRPIVFPGATKQRFEVTRADNTQVVVIPDVVDSNIVGDIKNWASLSYTQQLQDFALVADPSNAMKVMQGQKEISARRRLEILVRHSSHPQGETKVSGNLKSAARTVGAGGGKIHYAITNLEEQIEKSRTDRNAWDTE